MKIESLKATLSNRDDESRAHTIEGTVNVKNGKANVENGYVYGDNGEHAASISEYENGQLNITYNVKSGRAAILSEVETFVEAAKIKALETLEA